MRRTTSQKGFSLIELLLVVAIIGILAGIAVPNFMVSRRASNEAGAISALRTVCSAQQIYIQHRGNNINYAPDLPTLATEDLLDRVLGGGATSTRSGYVISMAGGVGDFQAGANPTVPGSTGVRYFFTDGSGLIRFATAGPAGATDTPLR